MQSINFTPIPGFSCASSLSRARAAYLWVPGAVAQAGTKSLGSPLCWRRVQVPPPPLTRDDRGETKRWLGRCRIGRNCRCTDNLLAIAVASGAA